MDRDPAVVRRRVVACAAALVVLPALAACEAYVDMPVRQVSHEKVEKSGTGTATAPAYTSGNRLDFRDEYGARPPSSARSRPARRAARRHPG